MSAGAPGADVAMADERVDEYLQVPPAVPLRPYIGWYSGYRQRGVEPAVHRGLPSPYLTLIFTLYDPLTVVAHPDVAQPGGCYDTLLGGLHQLPALINHGGAQSGVQVAVSPLGCRLLFGVPAGALASLDLAVDDVLPGFGARVRDRLMVEGSWAGRFAALDGLLLARLDAGRDDVRAELAPEVIRAWDLVLRSRGRVTASALAAEVGWSGKHLAARFGEEVGLTPKLAARVVRFDQARRLLTRQDRGLADLAFTCGYADQAHLTREFREMSGCSPTVWLAAESGDGFRNLQDLRDADLKA